MKRCIRPLEILIAVVLVLVLGWQIIATRVSDWLAPSAPRQALGWDAHNPAALLALAEQQLQDKQPEQAAASARELLRTSPLQAQGFAVLARAAAAEHNTDTAQRLFAIAVARAPRDQYARGWMIGNQMQHGEFAAALDNINVLFGFAGQQERTLIPLLGEAAGHDPKLATALGHFLATKPAWRTAMLDELLAKAPLPAVDRVFSTIQANGKGLSDAEAGRWFARLERAGRWGEAYSRWIGRVGAGAGGSIAAVYNGGFEQPATGDGFNWSMRGEPGVAIERVHIAGASGRWAAQVTFRNRRADAMGFAQTVLLAPGRYTLSFRARAADLHSDLGLQWAITCVTGGPAIASSPALQGSFDWKTVSADFSVPATDCPAQRLALVNPGAGGSGKVVSGQLWVDAFQITPASAQAPPAAATQPAAPKPR